MRNVHKMFVENFEERRDHLGDVVIFFWGGGGIILNWI